MYSLNFWRILLTMIVVDRENSALAIPGFIVYGISFHTSANGEDQGILGHPLEHCE
jgi:hypothetical protein